MPTSIPRQAPEIPDHEMLQMIGGGSYGQVYLARTVTGVLRAVKVVWREDFDDDRTFEREFDGILKYEPLSRDHAGLVNVLHIGRSIEEGKFYYYVMELGDDVEAGQDFEIENYEARTLRSDTRAARGKPIGVDDCIEVAQSLGDALGYLHRAGLAHRDVKPSNVIFVEGKAQLADIGLVAAAGGRTFVGTEGFVPPEGPGTAQADFYSLGKVLYEMASGKDRLEFPELPDELPGGDERKRWLALNRVICDMCEPRLSQRTVTTSDQLEERLSEIDGGRMQRKTRKRLAFAAVAAVILAWLGLTSAGRGVASNVWTGLGNLVREQLEDEPTKPQEPEYGAVFVGSFPEEGADIIDAEGQLLGFTPSLLENLVVGRDYSFTLRLRGYQDTEFVVAVADEAVSVEMKPEQPPVADKPWTDALGLRYGPRENSHVSYALVRVWMFELFQREAGTDFQMRKVPASENGRKLNYAAVSEEAAWQYMKWMSERCVAQGLLTDSFVMEPIMEPSPMGVDVPDEVIQSGLQMIRGSVFEYQPGVLMIATSPPNATILIDGEPLDEVTPAMITINKPGRITVDLALDGYKPESRIVRLESGGEAIVDLSLEVSKAVNFTKTWTNGLAMPFEPIAQDLLVGRHEVRLGDFRTYAKEAGVEMPPAPTFPQGEDHPIVNVTRSEARDFCVWLTERERREELIGASHEYRLPSDAEWSLMVGREELPLLTPSERAGLAVEEGDTGFPWGEVFPPVSETGKPLANVADSALAGEEKFGILRTIPDYTDGFAFTAPVGSFGASENGLCDLSGNVNEWVRDAYGQKATFGTLRGGGWNTKISGNLEIAWRSAVAPDHRGEFYGFRVVLAKVPTKAVRVELEEIELEFEEEEAATETEDTEQ